MMHLATPTPLVADQPDPMQDAGLLRRIVESSAEAILILDGAGTILSANPATRQLWGEAPEQLVGLPLAQLIAPPFRWRADAGEAEPAFEVEGLSQDGRRIPLRLTLSRFDRPSGPLYIGILNDMSALRRARSDIAKLSLALEHCSSMVVLARLDGIIEYVNGRFCEVTGYRRDEVIGQHSRLLNSGHAPPGQYSALWADITAGRPWSGEFHNRYKDGSLHWVAATISPIRDEAGDIAGFFAIEDDITESKATRDALRLSQERLSVAIEAIDDGFAVYDADERLVMCNDRYREMLLHNGVTDQVGARFEDLVRACLEYGIYSPLNEDTDTWMARRLAIFRAAEITIEQPLADGRWIQASERRTPDGGRVALRTDVTLLKQVQEQLRHAKEDADAASHAKSDFLSKMSHELRTPLNGILGFGEMLKINPAEPPTPLQERCINHILEAGQHLLTLINEILDLARIEAGRLTINLASVVVDELVADCVELLEPQATANGITVVATAPSTDTDGLVVQADPMRLKQVLFNLLSNAIKYNRPGGRVAVSFGGAAGSVGWIEVTDTGIGMTTRQMERLFTPFDRLGIEAVNSDGTGIGLSITRQLVEAMGGRMEVHSLADTGSTFRVEIPTGFPSAEREQDGPVS